MKINVCQPACHGGIVQSNPTPRPCLPWQSGELDSFSRSAVGNQTTGDLQVSARGKGDGRTGFNRQRGALRNLQRAGYQDGFLRRPNGVALE